MKGRIYTPLLFFSLLLAGVLYKIMGEVYLIVGLGNPGRQYESSRHNAGFMALDVFAERFNLSWERWQNDKGLLAKAEFEGNTLYLLKPMTYMNLSGHAVRGVTSFYKIKPQNILIIFDDMSLPLGSVRLRAKGSAGGQNGMRHIIEQLGTQDIARLRIGIGPRPEYFEGKDFVLSKFTEEQKPLLKEALIKADSAVYDFIASGIDRAMTKANAQ